MAVLLDTHVLVWWLSGSDRLIVATARAYRRELATHDASLRKLRVAPLWRA